MSRILITGAAGLIGTALTRRLGAAGHDVIGFDIAAPGGGRGPDIRDASSLAAAVAGCSGIVHLAAVSRVVWGEQDPERCHQVNVAGTSNVLAAARDGGARSPWVLVASSREVYGQAARFPVPESAPFQPLNAYARSKVDVENLVALAQGAGVRASVVRFSSVYGTAADHPDRVAPAFARLAADGGDLRIDGAATTLDFTHIEDVASGLHLASDLFSADGGRLPPLHLVSGRGTTLVELAQIALSAAGCGGRIELVPPRPYDVVKFIGDPARAARILGWRANITLEEGMRRLVDSFRTGLGTASG